MLNAITSYLWGDAEEDCENAPVLGAGDQTDCNPESQDSGDWIIVHPAGKGARPLESSSMENLLMEHPSMSVYHRGTRGGKAVPRKALVGRRRRGRGDLKKETGTETTQQELSQDLPPRRLHTGQHVLLRATPLSVTCKIEKERQLKNRWAKTKAFMKRSNNIKGDAHRCRNTRQRYQQPARHNKMC